MLRASFRPFYALGTSRNEFYLIPLVVEFVAFLLVMTIADHMYKAIIEITDDLYLMRDGYTFPIKSREDLIHHGYILR